MQPEAGSHEPGVVLNLTDIHCHLLPDLDDGPANLAETVAMLGVAHASGTRRMVATPHLYFEAFSEVTIRRVQQRFAETLAHMEESAKRSEAAYLGEIELALGAEHFIGPAFFEALERREVLTLNRSRYLLIEFSLALPFEVFRNAVRRIRRCGYVPVLAHVERYHIFQRDPSLLSRFLEMGCLTQLNAQGLTGSFWSKRKRLALEMLENEWISLIASDAHGPERRPPDLGPTFEMLSRKFSRQQTENWLIHHPNWVLAHPAPTRS